jgi:hypothetical protein
MYPARRSAQALVGGLYPASAARVAPGYWGDRDEEDSWTEPQPVWYMRWQAVRSCSCLPCTTSGSALTGSKNGWQRPRTSSKRTPGDTGRRAGTGLRHCSASRIFGSSSRACIRALTPSSSSTAIKTMAWSEVLRFSGDLVTRTRPDGWRNRNGRRRVLPQP